jgi:O-antigen ligase
MPSGVTWNANHTDITNHYLQMGVMGGLPLMFLFIGLLATAFVYVGRRVKLVRRIRMKDRFVIWALGSALFAHATTFISVSYFDQSAMFIYLTLAAIGSVCHAPLPAKVRKPAARADATSPYELVLQTS